MSGYVPMADLKTHSLPTSLTLSTSPALSTRLRNFFPPCWSRYQREATNFLRVDQIQTRRNSVRTQATRRNELEHPTVTHAEFFRRCRYRQHWISSVRQLYMRE